MIMFRPKTTASVRVVIAGFLACAPVALTLFSLPAAAVEQCRFMQAKLEREACYKRQEAELAAKQKPEPRRDTTMEAVQQMKQEDQALDRQIHSICRGC
jgi:septation ring formation regulator EzrA